MYVYSIYTPSCYVCIFAFAFIITCMYVYVFSLQNLVIVLGLDSSDNKTLTEEKILNGILN